jgi:hypothetical protein
MPKRIRNRELELLRKGSRGPRGRDDARELPPFHSPRAGKHSRIAGRGKHKAKRGYGG